MRLRLAYLAWIVGGAQAAAESIAPQPDPQHNGIVLFTTLKEDGAAYAPLAQPAVKGAEAIVWWSEVEPEPEQYDWAALDRLFALCQRHGKFLDIRLSAAHAGPQYTPDWVFTQGLRRIGRGRWLDCEEGADGYELLSGARVRRDDAHAIGGTTSIFADNQSSGSRRVLSTSAAPTLPAPCKHLSVQFDYKLAADTKAWVNLERNDGSPVDPPQRLTFSGRAGDSGMQTMAFRLGEHPDYRLVWGMDGPGALSIDHINIIPIHRRILELSTDMESGYGPWQFQEGASLTRLADEVVEGSASILLERTNEGYAPQLINDPALMPISAGTASGWRTEVLAHQDSTLRLRVGNAHGAVTEREFILKAGERRSLKAGGGYVPENGYRVELGLVGPGSVSVDNILRRQWSSVVTVFPNYFDPQFPPLWQRMLLAFRARYGDHPSLGTISIGGIGRWDEVMLDDDQHGVLDPQWIALGFSQERYLAHIERMMDLYREIFPERPLRICLAYGLRHSNDVDWTYRRTATAAAMRGIGIKQNGMSESYARWDADTNGAYLIRRHAYDPQVQTTYETGGQIYRNSFNAMGHPLSLLNRALLDGADNLFLYGPDIADPVIHRYLDQFNAQAGCSLFTRYHIRFGAFEMPYQGGPQVNHNQWLGLRHAAEFTPARFGEVDGVSHALIEPGQSLSLDLDDRTQYLNLYGATISVAYSADTPAPEIVLGLRGEADDTWKDKTLAGMPGNDGWHVARMPIGRALDRAQDGGEDQHQDIRIRSDNDRPLMVRAAWLDFVPPEAWKTMPLATNAPTDRHRELTVPTTFSIPPPVGCAWLRLKLWSEGLHSNRVRVEVRPADGRSTVRERYLFSDGEWFNIPIAHLESPKNLQVTVTPRQGRGGIYLGQNGEPAYAIDGYTGARSDQSAAIFSGESFFVSAPFHALDLARLPAKRPVQVRLESVDGNHPIAEREILPSATGAPVRFHHEPQPPGRYRLVATLTPAEPFTATPVHLVRRRPSNPNSAVFAFQHLPLIGAGRPAPSPTAPWTMKMVSGESAVETPVDIRLDAAPGHRWQFILSNRTGSSWARLYWRRNDEEFSAARSEWIPIVPNDSEIRHYQWPIGQHPRWTGKIHQLRFVPAGTDPIDGEVDFVGMGVFQRASNE